MEQAKWTIEFWENTQGRKPVLDWIKGDLTKGKRFAVGKAMEHVLQVHGPDCCNDKFGKNLGGGLYEFRLDNTADELLRRFEGEQAADETTDAPPEKVLLRVFFSVEKGRIVLLLGALDKGVNPKEAQQQSAITEARKRLTAHKEKMKRVAKQGKRRA